MNFTKNIYKLISILGLLGCLMMGEIGLSSAGLSARQLTAAQINKVLDSFESFAAEQMYGSELGKANAALRGSRAKLKIQRKISDSSAYSTGEVQDVFAPISGYHVKFTEWKKTQFERELLKKTRKEKEEKEAKRLEKEREAADKRKKDLEDAKAADAIAAIQAKTQKTQNALKSIESAEELKRKKAEREQEMQLKAQERKQENTQKAEAEEELMAARARGATKAVSTPMIVGASIFLTTVGGYYLLKLGMPALFMAKPPQIINETSIKLGVASLVHKIKYMKKKAPRPESRRGDMVYPPELSERLDQIIESTQQAIERHRPLMNMLFYGPPGTGKTLFAKEVAKQSGADYIITSGSNLMQLSVKDALFQLKEMLNLAEKNPTPVILFFDEADSVFMHRKNASEDALKLTNMFLTLVDKPSNPKLMIIFATNRPGELDDAIMSRISKHSTLFFKPPGPVEREKMIQVYFKKNLEAKNYKIDLGVLEHLPKLAKSIDGWAGREIEQLTLDLAVQLELKKKDVLTKDVLEKVVSEIFKNGENLRTFEK